MIKWLKNMFAIEHDSLKYEDRYVLTSSLIVGLFSLISTYNNYSLGFSPLVVYVPGFSVFVYLGIFFIGKYLKKFTLVKQLITIYTFLFLNFMWVYNYGSNGPVVFAFVVFYSFLTFILNTRSLIFYSIVIFSNILVLFYLDYNYPSLIPDYPSVEVRQFDFYIGVLFFLFFVLAVSLSAKMSYFKEYENAKRSDQLKSAFLANMSHEIRTPLNSIVGFSELLCDDNLTKEKKKRFVKIIQDNNHSLLRLIEDILDISRIESNQLRIEKQSCNLPELLSGIDMTYQKLLKAKGINIALKLESNKSNITIQTDVSRLHQIIINLIDNALKFTEEGQIRFGFNEVGNMLEFYVVDTGIGIKEEHLSKLFDRFYKIETNKGKLYKGTGIGLSLCKDLVVLLGGHIWVESKFGEGTTFFFTLPKA